MLAFMAVEQKTPPVTGLQRPKALGAVHISPSVPPVGEIIGKGLSHGQESLAVFYRSAGSMPMT